LPRMMEPESRKSRAAIIAREVREIIGRIVYGENAPEKLEASGRSIPIHDVLLDLNYFQRQMASHVSPIVVYLKDHDPVEVAREREIPIVAKFSDLTDFHSSIERIFQAASQSGLKADTVSQHEGMEIFGDRLSDFIVSRATASGGSAMTDTIIDSNRIGDTVLYAMGYFYSTGTACGRSTPATVKLLPGRYSFGIMNGHIPDFDGTVWAVPTANGHVSLNKP
jgi:hypothetical protein